ncbi:hypothetical protein [Gemmatimonas groenlandica]|uniref:Outer membrane protein beta-barrel domain-containing protein n=1 Tax=Gemmatimonas groenlandica TaxID=2732249 RepID=A0A6M4IPW6_9BACT|nr:hypothetical protein [Gemmatimonas groenlandica]QJR36760.1 hypothetical protein HKW67_15175 [Gemmatimonas groenlandica]
MIRRARLLSLATPIALALTLALRPLAAQTAPLPTTSAWRGVARVGLEYGGEKVVQFRYEDGTTPTVTAGGGLLLTVGGVYRAWSQGGHAVELQGQGGIKWRTIPAATNQDANWLRFPVEGLVFYRAPAGVRLGAGATVHLHNVLKASGEVLDSRLEFANDAGLLVQAEYVRGDFAFDLRVTSLTYRTADAPMSEVGASSVGVGASWFFPGTRQGR